MQKLKLLISAYACEPGKGSEPGVGWRWALETAALGHDVWVLTRSNNEPGINREMTRIGHPANLHFIYFDLSPRVRWWKRGGFSVHIYYLLWQWGAYKFARQQHTEQRFDAVHHLTFGVIRHPSFMGRLGIPFIVGPLGGGERAPRALRKPLAFSGRIKDTLRDTVNWLARYDPWLRQMYAQAALILMKTPQSLSWLPQKYQGKAHCMLEIGIDARLDTATQYPEPAKNYQTLHLIYVGRFLYWKGMDLGLRAAAELMQRGLPLRLTMIGQGRERKRWQTLTAQLKLAGCVTWVPWMKQQDLLHAYRTFDALLFPSLHDSSGNVVLEAMASGLPVVCLDLGGPAQLVDETCGRVVAVDDRDAQQVITAMADALTELAQNRNLLAELRSGALLKAQAFGWQQVIAQVWGEGGLGCQVLHHNPMEREQSDATT
jgi:glycosyltransferase involved in cell wall biosynthesis